MWGTEGGDRGLPKFVPWGVWSRQMLCEVLQPNPLRKHRIHSPRPPCTLAVRTTRSKALRSPAEALRSNAFADRTRFLCNALAPHNPGGHHTALPLPPRAQCPMPCHPPRLPVSGLVSTKLSGPGGQGPPFPAGPRGPLHVANPRTGAPWYLGLMAGRGEGLGRALELGRGRGVAWPLPPASTLAGTWGRW